MLLDITDILQESGLVMAHEFCLDADDVGDVQLTEKVNGEIHIQNARRNVIIKGDVNASVQLSCSRCLEQFDYPAQLTLEATAPISLFHLPGRPKMVEDDEGEEALLDEEVRALFVENSLNISELVRQAVWLQIPINPLCSVDCSGLAEFASQDKNTDPRLEQLKNWSNRSNDSTLKS